LLIKMATLKALPIYVTDQDKTRLQGLIRNFERANGWHDDLRFLAAELARATVVEPETIPNDVVTMNSCISVLDLETSEVLKFTLVYTEYADASANKISILAPVGLAMLGYRVDDEIEWKVPAGKRRFQITKVHYQPQ